MDQWNIDDSFQHGTITLIDILGTKNKSKEGIKEFVNKIKNLHLKLEEAKELVNQTFRRTIQFGKK
jgi:hypothetical protein